MWKKVGQLFGINVKILWKQHRRQQQKASIWLRCEMTRISLISLLCNVASVKGKGKLVCIEFWWIGKYHVPQILIWVNLSLYKMTQNCVIVQFLANIESHIPLTCSFLPLRIFWLAKAEGSQVRSIKIMSTEFQLSIKSSEPTIVRVQCLAMIQACLLNY